MQSYAQWQQNKMYFDHIDRLTQIRDRSIKKFKVQCYYRQRTKTSPSKNKKVENRRRLPLPLVSQRERKLLNNAMDQKQFTLKQKQTLLENYLLGRRILTTQPVIRVKQMKKQFMFHKQVSKNMSRSLQSQSSNNIIRTMRYKIYQHHSSTNQSKKLYNLSLKISRILLIKTRLDFNPQIQYNLCLCLSSHKRLFETKPFSGSDFYQKTFNFALKKKEIELRKNKIFRMQIICLRKNEEMVIGAFIVDYNKILQQSQQNPQQQQHSTHKIKTIENITRNQGKVVIGSIQYEFILKKSY